MTCWLASLIAASWIAACGGDPTIPEVTPPDTVEVPDTTTVVVPDADLELVVNGLDRPIYLTAAPGDASRLFVAEKGGLIRIVRDGVLQSTPFLDISSITSDSGERGLLGLAFHPDYVSNGFVFVHHSDITGDTRIVRYEAGSADELDASSATLVLDVTQPETNHNGGQIAFGPDGMLYIGLGDGGSAGDPDGNGQNRGTLLGSILRIDVDAIPYTVPADNPFVGVGAARSEIWAYGLRNPWRFSFDRATGDLYVADVGQNRREEISIVPDGVGGMDLGWNVMEGSLCYPEDPCDSTDRLLPVFEYGHSEGCSISGGYVYRGSEVPGLAGRYFYADYCQNWIRSFLVTGGIATAPYDHTDDVGPVARIVSFGEDNAGSLYVISQDGAVYRLVAAD